MAAHNDPDFHVDVNRREAHGPPGRCEVCGGDTTYKLNAWWFCDEHRDEGVGMVVRMEAFRVGAPPEVSEEATEWLLDEIHRDEERRRGEMN